MYREEREFPFTRERNQSETCTHTKGQDVLLLLVAVFQLVWSSVTSRLSPCPTHTHIV